MSANFTPTLHEYTDLTPFRFWCQKILPLAYDDSLSYYELLCKVVDYLNKTMEDVTLSIEDVENLHSAYVALQGYVNNYFNNLDVQEEINNKLDALVADGTIHTIFTPDVNAILTQAQNNANTLINNANTAATNAIAAIPNNVTSWLNTHITQETGYVIDNTLTVSGAAADARVTGDKIGELKSEISEIDLALTDKNVFVLDDVASYTDGGITISVTDGVISMSGTSTRNVLISIPLHVGKTGKYYFIGCPARGSSTQYFHEVTKSGFTGREYGGGRIIELANGDYTYSAEVVSGRTVDISFTPALYYIPENTIFSPAILYGGWAAHGTAPYTGSYTTWANNRKRTDIMYLKAGSSIGCAIPVIGTLEFEIFEYYGLNQNFFIQRTTLQGTSCKWTAAHDGYYAFNIRKISAQAITIDEITTNCVFYCKGEPDYRPKIHFIGSGNLAETSTATDVGDCTLITFYDGNNLLIDTANGRNYTSIEKRLYSAGVKKIKNMILTHYHTDHVSGLIQMVTDGYIDITGATVYLPNATETQWAYDNGAMDNTTKGLWDQVMQILTDNNCNIVYPSTEWETVKISNTFITFFNVDMSYLRTSGSTNYNDWSLCNYLMYGDMNVCFTGDIGPIAQGHLDGTLYKSNIYKADHHGWLNQPNIPAGYIENVSPDVVIAEDGQTHDDLLIGPNAPLIRWCEANGVPYYRKYQNNEIVVALDEQAYEFITKVSRYYRPTT